MCNLWALTTITGGLTVYRWLPIRLSKGLFRNLCCTVLLGLPEHGSRLTLSRRKAIDPLRKEGVKVPIGERPISVEPANPAEPASTAPDPTHVASAPAPSQPWSVNPNPLRETSSMLAIGRRQHSPHPRLGLGLMIKGLSVPGVGRWQNRRGLVGSYTWGVVPTSFEGRSFKYEGTSSISRECQPFRGIINHCQELSIHFKRRIRHFDGKSVIRQKHQSLRRNSIISREYQLHRGKINHWENQSLREKINHRERILIISRENQPLRPMITAASVL